MGERGDDSARRFPPTGESRYSSDSFLPWMPASDASEILFISSKARDLFHQARRDQSGSRTALRKLEKIEIVAVVLSTSSVAAGVREITE